MEWQCLSSYAAAYYTVNPSNCNPSSPPSPPPSPPTPLTSSTPSPPATTPQGAAGPGLMLDLSPATAARLQAISAPDDACAARIPGWSASLAAADRTKQSMIALAAAPITAITNNLMHGTRGGLWLGGAGVPADYSPAAATSPAVLVGNSAYKVRVTSVEPFEACLRSERLFNFRCGVGVQAQGSGLSFRA